jgi:chromosome segregation ATPase
MSHHGYARNHLFYGLLILCLALASTQLLGIVAAAETGDEDKALNEQELRTLQSTLNELRALAPKLRISLRTLRQRVGFDPREVHKIERGLGQSQKDLERMIAMHQREAFNKMRAHFMADDLRRKSERLKQALGYVKRRIRELDQAVGDGVTEAELKRSDDALLEQLGLYSNLVSGSVTLLLDKGI